MEDRRVVGPDEDPGEGDGPLHTPSARGLVVALEQEARMREADADGGARQDGPEARLVQARGHRPDPRLQVELRHEPPDRVSGPEGEQAGDSERDDALDQREAPTAGVQSVLLPGQDLQGAGG